MSTIDSIRRDNLRLLIAEQYGGVAAAFARRHGIHPSQVHQWLHASPDARTGKPRAISTRSARLVEKLVGKPVGWMDQPVLDFVQVTESAPGPGGLVAQGDGQDFVLIQQCMGAGCGVPTHQGVVAFRRDWLKRDDIHPDSVRAILAPDDAMAPLISEGALVLVDRDQLALKNGRVYALLTADGEVRLRRLFKDVAGGWRLACDNPQKHLYPDEPIEDPRHIDVLGRCVWRGDSL